MAVNDKQVTVKIEYSDHSAVVRTGLSAKDAASIVRGLEGEGGVTVAISQEGLDETLKVAVDYAWAFLGIERLDGVLQYVPRADECLETQPFTIGGQEVDMESRYISSVPTASDVVEEWVLSGETSSFGYWERQ